MTLAEHIVITLLETGEADQDYDHEFMDKIVKALRKVKLPGATHREFDKYQGVYLNIPGIDKFWVEHWYTDGSGVVWGIDVVPEHDKGVQDNEWGDKTTIRIQDIHGIELEDLMSYINKYHLSRYVHLKTQAGAEKFLQKLIKQHKSHRPVGDDAL